MYAIRSYYAGVKTDAATDGGKGHFFAHQCQGFVEFAQAGQVHVPADIDTGRAGVFTGRLSGAQDREGVGDGLGKVV